jgi:5'-3' exonuclease
MQTIPGLLLNDKKAREGMALDSSKTYADFISEVTPEEADYYHMRQTLTGDVTDGYPGCPGIGPVRADTLLVEGIMLTPSERTIMRGARKGEKEITWTPTTPGTPWEVIVSAYAAAGLSEEVALLNARVARIARASDYDFTNKEIKLWTPARDATTPSGATCSTPA